MDGAWETAACRPCLCTFIERNVMQLLQYILTDIQQHGRSESCHDPSENGTDS